MRLKNNLILVILFLFILIIFAYLSQKNLSNFSQVVPNNPNITISPTITLQATPTSTSSADVYPFGEKTKSSNCVSVDGLPDKQCTPGAIDPTVTQDNIDQTICVAGYSQTVRPSSSYTDELKIEQISQYNFTDTNTKDYEEDHLISLELGGAPQDPANLWPEPGASPNPKDKIENLCHKKICNHQISLKQAQLEIASDWHTACQN